MSIRLATVWAMGGHYSTFVIQFATSVIISRFFLLPADVGLFSIALAAAMMVSIFQDMGFSRFVTGQPQMREEFVRDYAAVAFAAGLAVATALTLAARPLAHFYANAGLEPLIRIIAAAFLVQSLAIVPGALVMRAMNFRALFIANVGSALTGGAVGIWLAAQGLGAASLAWSMLAAAIIRAAALIAHRPVLPRLPRDIERVRPMIGFGSSAFLLSLSGAIGQRSQDLIVGRVLGLAATGLFTRASSLAGQVSMLMVGAINGVFYPAFARKRDAGEKLDEPYLHLVACNTALGWAAAVGLALAAEPVVRLLYGPNWAEVTPLLRWTAIAEALFVAVPLQMDIPILLGRIRTLVWINLFDTAITIALLAVFSLWGLEAAAISRVVIGLFWWTLYITYIRRLLAIPRRRLALVYLRSLIVALAAGVPLALALHCEWFGPRMGLFALLAMAGAGVIVWLAAMRLIGHPAWQEVRLLAGRLGPAGAILARL